MEGCGADPDHEFARCLAGKYTVFRISYTAKTKRVFDEEHQNWITWPQAAKVVK